MLETKHGIPITLCVLYSCVVSRLGVLTLPVNFPGHFLLKWMEHPDQTEDYNKYTFIDAFSDGRLMTAQQARDLRPHLVHHNDTHEVASPVDISQRMLRNLISIGANTSNRMLRDTCYGLLRSSLEMMIEWYGPGVDDAYLEYGFMLSRVYLQLNINHEVSERLL